MKRQVLAGVPLCRRATVVFHTACKYLRLSPFLFLCPHGLTCREVLPQALVNGWPWTVRANEYFLGLSLYPVPGPMVWSLWVLSSLWFPHHPELLCVKNPGQYQRWPFKFHRVSLPGGGGGSVLGSPGSRVLASGAVVRGQE